MDGEILLFIQGIFVNESLTPIFAFITHLGNKGMIWIALSVGLLLFKKTRPIGIMVALALIFSYLINNLMLKNLIMRTRPYEVIPSVKLLIEAQHDYSFPSGHASSSFAAAIAAMRGIRIYGYYDKYKICYYALLALAIIIAFTRLYLGVHYPTDVIFGILSGVVIGLFVWKLPLNRFYN